jgi:dCMP deaminase
MTTLRARLKDLVFLEMAKSVTRLSTCARRSVGCVLVDSRARVLATGYNGVAAGMPHCSEGHRCAAADAPSGTRLDACEAIHAEANALLQCRAIDLINVAYVTTPPCVACTKLLLNTGCSRIVALGDYPQAEAAKELWERAGRVWSQLDQIVSASQT